MQILDRCSVLGCYQATVICSRHKRFGLVASCRDHNPLKHAYDAPLILEAGAVVILPEYQEINARIAGTWTGEAPGGSGGAKVPAGKPGPHIPPSDGAALAAPAALEEIAF